MMPLGRDVSRLCVDDAHDKCWADWCECECHGTRAELRLALRMHRQNPWRIVAPVAIVFTAIAAALLVAAAWSIGWRPW